VSTLRIAIVAATVLAAAAGQVCAEPTTLRFASIAPEGTVWAHQLKQFARDVEAATGGELRIKWYLSGVAGDERTTLERLHAGQLDGSTGTELCQRLAPTLRATTVFGLFQNQEEADYVLARIRPRLDEELHRNGFVNLGVVSFGHMIMFARQPVRSMADLTRGTWWAWDIDPIWRLQLAEMGLHVLPLPVAEGARAFEGGRTDGFMSVPAIALGLQWSALARSYTPLPVRFLPACFVIADRAIDPLPIPQQKLLRSAAARLMKDFERTAQAQDAQLLGGLFERQGLRRVRVEPAFRDAFYAAARAARERLGEKLVPRELLQRILELLAELRARRG
jgi:TRAP-type C4-dicarboxylate transport system substrate-binding protein